MTKKKDKNAPAEPPKRINTHQIDTQAVRTLETSFPADWMVRHQQDRDYGIDLMVEIFDDESPTGGLILLQVKGRQAKFASVPVRLQQFPVKTLLYAEMFSAPFLLCHVSIEERKTYFVWLQKYIKTRLPIDYPDWRKRDDVVIEFPVDNVLDEMGRERIARMARHTVHRDLGLTFMGYLSWLIRHIREILSGDFDFVPAAVENLKAIQNLSGFIDVYSDAVPDLDVSQLIRTLEKAAAYREFDQDDDNYIDTQLDELVMVQALFLSQDERDVFVVENTTTALPY